MDHGLELIIPILEILEIEVSIIPIWLKSWKLKSPWFPYGRNTGGGRAAPGVRLRGAWIIFGVCSWNFVTCPIWGNNRFRWFGVILGHWRRRRRRRRADNSPIWPNPWTITPKDQISRAGNPSLRWYSSTLRCCPCSSALLTRPIRVSLSLCGSWWMLPTTWLCFCSNFN